MPVVESAAMVLLLWTAAGYLFGSIPFGMLLARLMGLGNLREIGSGNIGATNVLRTGNKLAAALTLILDGGKGALAVLLAHSFAGEDAAQLAGFSAMLGHCFPIWLRFAGGKGVATFLGIVLALSLPVGLACCGAWLLGALTSRISSMGALVAAAAAAPLAWLLGTPSAILLCLMLALLIYWRHRANISRIIAGTEPKIGKKS